MNVACWSRDSKGNVVTLLVHCQYGSCDFGHPMLRLWSPDVATLDNVATLKSYTLLASVDVATLIMSRLCVRYRNSVSEVVCKTPT